jgi:acetyltransferase
VVDAGATRHNLDSLYRPKSVAVVGASRAPQKWGSIILKNIVDGGFAGSVYPINPTATELQGHKCFPMIAAVPFPIDMAFVTLAASQVRQAVEDCADAGVGTMVLASSGFAETGDGGRAKQQELVDIARVAGMRLVGPNCMGVYSSVGSLYASMALEPQGVGGIAVLSQSGNVGLAVFRLGHAAGLRFHSFISVGNQADLTIADYLLHLAQDDACTVVCAYIEGVVDGVRLRDAIRTCVAKKPVIILKGGGEVAGQRAAAFHTGSLASDGRVFRGVVEQAGAIVVSSYEQLIVAAQTLSSNPVGKRARRVAILTDGGGFGVLAADAVSRSGLEVAALSSRTQERLRGLLPDYCSIANPVDVGGDTDSNPAVFLSTTAALLDDENVDAVLITSVLGIYGSAFDASLTPREMEVAQQLPATVLDAGKVCVVQSVAARESSPILTVLAEQGLPSLESVELAVAGLAAVDRYAQNRAIAASEAALSVLDYNADESVQPVTEPDLYDMLQAHGLPVPRYRVASSVHEARTAADAVGTPVVAKAIVPGMHKTDVGAIVANLVTPTAIEAAYASLSAHSQDVLIAEQVPAGAEVIVSVTRNGDFGSVVMCGLGGRLVEALSSAAFASSPLGAGDAERLIARTPFLSDLPQSGPRGVRLQELVEILECVDRLMSHRKDLLELELNPVIMTADRTCIVDAKARWE